MSRNKIIVISLIVSLSLLLIINVVYSKYINSNDLEVYMLIEDIIKNEKITLDKVKKIKLSNNTKDIEFVQVLEESIYAATSLTKRTNFDYRKYNCKS